MRSCQVFTARHFPGTGQHCFWSIFFTSYLNIRQISWHTQLTLTLQYSHLQTKPEARPSLEQILQHSFFTRSGVSTPSQLPEAALREAPVFSTSDVADGAIGKRISKIVSEVFTFFFSSRAQGITMSNLHGNYLFICKVVYGNENDPLGANRIHANNQIRQKITSPNPKDLGSKLRFSNQVAVIQRYVVCSYWNSETFTVQNSDEIWNLISSIILTCWCLLKTLNTLDYMISFFAILYS